MTADTHAAAEKAGNVHGKSAAFAMLRQGVWEASQFTTASMIRAYVESVLREIESDEP